MPANLPIEPSDARCLVCDKSIEGGGGFCRLKMGDSMIALCCPLCLDTFNANTPRYEAKFRVRSLGLLADQRFTP